MKEVDMATQSEIKEEVKRRYGAAAKRAKAQQQSGECCGAGDGNGISSKLYATDELQHLPQDAVAASLGCGNPVAVAELKEGEVVLDLGSGGGIDVLLSARRVGPAGKAYGLDMTDEMLDLARKNASEAGVSNVEFLRGEMENIPLPRNTADVIISNCVVNLSPDKDAVLREAYRVLKPGGRLAISDIVTNNDLPVAVKENMAAWTGCIAGALTRDDYIAKLQAAGFEGAEIETFREYTTADAAAGGLGDEVREVAGGMDEGVGVFSGVVRARKPTALAVGEKIEVLSAPDSGAACRPGECC
jgi:ubiquinone/menaquinone biosynthesis C-methylase UbiE